MKPGDVFWIYDAEVDRHHPHIVLTYPEPYNGEDWIAVVNITTIHGNRYDRTTVLQPHDHARLTSASYVYYQKADFERVSDLSGNDYASPIEPLSNPVFERVLDGLFKSKWTTADVQTYVSVRVGPHGLQDKKGTDETVIPHKT